MKESTNTATSAITTARAAYTTTSTDLGVLVSVDLPGVAKEDVTITSNKQQLKIQAQRNDSPPKDWSLVNHSSPPTHYDLTLSIHPDLDLSKTSAKVDNGVLLLQIDRRSESLPRKIEIDH